MDSYKCLYLSLLIYMYIQVDTGGTSQIYTEHKQKNLLADSSLLPIRIIRLPNRHTYFSEKKETPNELSYFYITSINRVRQLFYTNTLFLFY